MKIDAGCGKRKREGFVGVDVLPFDGVDVVCDLGKEPWPFANDTVDEVNASHMLEHLTVGERAHFVNEAFRVLKRGGKLSVQGPLWSSQRAYGDPTHVWPPVVAFWFYYLNAAWRAENAPHVGCYTCDFQMPQWGYAGENGDLRGRNPEFMQFALNHYIEAAMDMVATAMK